MMSLTAARLLHIQPAELEGIHANLGAGLTDASLQQSKLKTHILCEAPHVFQPRSFAEDRHLKSAHVRSLASADKQRGKARLEKILVFPVGGLRVVIDGHCRLRAYLKNDPEGKREIPIKYFRGSFREAMSEAARSNSHDKLPLSRNEKAEMAWRLVQLDEGRLNAPTLRAMEEQTGASKSLVGTMQKLLRSNPHGSDDDPRGLRWEEAKRGHRGSITYDESWEEGRIAAIAVLAAKTFGREGHKQPHVLLEGIMRAYPSVEKLVEDRIEVGIENESPHVRRSTDDF